MIEKLWSCRLAYKITNLNKSSGQSRDGDDRTFTYGLRRILTFFCRFLAFWKLFRVWDYVYTGTFFSNYKAYSIELLSINCRGLHNDDNRLIINEWLNDINCDIIFLQETHYIKDKMYVFLSRWHGSSSHNFFLELPHSKSVFILFIKKFSFQVNT